MSLTPASPTSTFSRTRSAWMRPKSLAGVGRVARRRLRSPRKADSAMAWAGDRPSQSQKRPHNGRSPSRPSSSQARRQKPSVGVQRSARLCISAMEAPSAEKISTSLSGEWDSGLPLSPNGSPSIQLITSACCAANAPPSGRATSKRPSVVAIGCGTARPLLPSAAIHCSSECSAAAL
ncbi:hypothetical protein D9M72_478900 [compost metagenome]